MRIRRDAGVHRSRLWSPDMSDEARISALPVWSHAVSIEPLAGGMTNRNYRVRDGGRAFVVRLGDDIPEHNVLRWHEAAVSRAAASAGLSPAVIHHEPGVLVLDFIVGEALTEERLRDGAMIDRVGRLLARAHGEIIGHVAGPVLAFWPFQVNRDYLRRLSADPACERGLLDRLGADNARLEAQLGPTATVLGHNDLLPGNILDDGERLWLIDWEYAGLGTPLFDLAGLASNAGYDEGQVERLLHAYEGQLPGGDAVRRVLLMQAVSLLRETLWSLTAERHSALDFDYSAYTAKTLARYAAAAAPFLR